MIITVTLNAALDISYRVAQLRPQQSHRVIDARQRAGGKGINVASVLCSMGHDVLALGLAAGTSGEWIRSDLGRRGIPQRLLTAPGEARRTVNVTSAWDGDATIFNEPGPQVGIDEWSRLAVRLVREIRDAAPSVVVLSGSLPPGMPSAGYAELTTSCHEAGARVILDATGEALAQALRAGPDLVKPNSAELTEVTGLSDPEPGAAALRALGARDVMVSAGADGLMLIPTSGPSLRAWLAQPLSGNPTGAGDAAVAALAAGLSVGATARELVRTAAAWSAAAVLRPVAGEVDPDDVDSILPRIQIAESGPVRDVRRAKPVRSDPTKEDDHG
jgi:1-phosphofructokinase family hexose kinase